MLKKNIYFKKIGVISFIFLVNPWLSSFPLLFLHLKDEMSNANRGGSKSSTPAKQESVSKNGTPQSLQSKSNSLMSSQDGTSKSNTYSANSQSTTPLSPHDGVSAGMSPVSTGSASATPLSTAASDVAMESLETPVQEQEVSEGLNKNLDRNGEKPESKKNIAAVQEVQQAQFGHDASTPLNDDGLYCS